MKLLSDIDSIPSAHMDDLEGALVTCDGMGKSLKKGALVEISRRAHLKALEDIAQSCRYYLKNQSLPQWESMTEFQKGVSVTCENILEIIWEEYDNSGEFYTKLQDYEAKNP